MILSIGNSGTYEIEAFRIVLDELRKNGYEAVHFKQDNCLMGEYLMYKIINGKMVYNIIIDGKTYNVNDFSGIWYMKPHLPRELINFEPVEYRYFIQRQFKAMRVALWSIFQNKKWIDNPWSIQVAEDKLYQLYIATEIGFNVPDTLVTSDPDKVRSFYKKNDKDIIVKQLSASPILNKVLFTNRVDDNNLKLIDSVKIAPSIFQKRISKKYELRITVVGEKIFTAKIHSQADESTSLDWRVRPKLNDFEVKMEKTDLPLEIKSKIKTFMDRLNLRFGCIDMIVDRKGEYVFLEINPNGQWYFVQLHTGAEIAKAIAHLLVK